MYIYLCMVSCKVESSNDTKMYQEFVERSDGHRVHSQSIKSVAKFVFCYAVENVKKFISC